MKVMLLIFATVFIAEIGDKTQLATMLFSAEGKASPMQVFIASAGALVVAAAIGVAAGQVIEKFVSPQALKVVAGAGFVAIGAFTLYSAWKPGA
ncbi:MAG TPA: TMEM165/GDT1 family protein [Xanthomonadaceae bacterium]|nr:TMEM165/GDT1 family protein [Xanthomonadaceae bacterium]